MQKTDSKIIVALDYPNAEQALAFVARISPAPCRLKVGKELFTSAGPEFVESLVELGYDVFLDLKFHDIPNTVNKAVSAAAALGVWMLNVHALGGSAMLQAAREAVEPLPQDQRPFLIAVTVLTSTDQVGLQELGINRSVEETVIHLSRISLDNGLDGMVCSALEVVPLRQAFGDSPLLVTPGIRPAGADRDDQSRIMTPEQAVAAGSSYLVIGRPITQSEDPVATLEKINQSLV
jgi:orotidine-5'-phosphate decarboxylase